MSGDYRIVSQDPTTELNPAGRGFRDVWEITYEVTSGAARGTVGRITVPDADHNAQYVDDAIRGKLAALHEIATLGQ